MVWDEARLRSAPAMSARRAKSVSWSMSRADLRDSSKRTSSSRLTSVTTGAPRCNTTSIMKHIRSIQVVGPSDIFNFYFSKSSSWRREGILSQHQKIHVRFYFSSLITYQKVLKIEKSHCGIASPPPAPSFLSETTETSLEVMGLSLWFQNDDPFNSSLRNKCMSDYMFLEETWLKWLIHVFVFYFFLCGLAVRTGTMI